MNRANAWNKLYQGKALGFLVGGQLVGLLHSSSALAQTVSVIAEPSVICSNDPNAQSKLTSTLPVYNPADGTPNKWTVAPSTGVKLILLNPDRGGNSNTALFKASQTGTYTVSVTNSRGASVSTTITANGAGLKAINISSPNATITTSGSQNGILYQLSRASISSNICSMKFFLEGNTQGISYSFPAGNSTNGVILIRATSNAFKGTRTLYMYGYADDGTQVRSSAITLTIR